MRSGRRGPSSRIAQILRVFCARFRWRAASAVGKAVRVSRSRGHRFSGCFMATVRIGLTKPVANKNGRQQVTVKPSIQTIHWATYEGHPPELSSSVP
jgi:hypothetical protein